MMAELYIYYDRRERTWMVIRRADTKAQTWENVREATPEDKTALPIYGLRKSTKGENMKPKRYALVYAPADKIRAYLPGNYQVEHEFTPDELTAVADTLKIPWKSVTLIEGRDEAGWTLDDYVIPRLASGLYFGEEIDLSHPAMKLVPE